jgi:hypothetical protein
MAVIHEDGELAAGMDKLPVYFSSLFLIKKNLLSIFLIVQQP